jgi:hypothetical protein
MNRPSPRAPWRPDSGFYVAYALYCRTTLSGASGATCTP